MKFVCPTITAENPHIYRQQIENVAGFAKRIHIDLMDGVFTKNKSVDISQVWLPEGMVSDVHVMFQKPESILSKLIELKPGTVIVHAESDCSIAKFAKVLRESGIKCGIAIFPETTIGSIRDALKIVDQVLIFSGNLGHQGGSVADLSLLSKIDQARLINPDLEIAWDGGVNEDNVKKLIDGGVDVINAGGFIQLSDNPEESYRKLVKLV